MSKFLEKYKTPKLTQEEIDNLTRTITNVKIESIMKILPLKKSSDLEVFTTEYYQTFKEALTPIIYKRFPKK